MGYPTLVEFIEAGGNPRDELAFRFARDDLRFDQQFTSFTLAFGTNHSRLAAGANEGLGRRAAKRAECREVADRFEQVRLALPIGTENRGETWRERDFC